MTLTAARHATGLEREQAIARAMAFPMDAIVERYREEQQLPAEVAREHERELKRFLVLCALDPDAPYGMNGPVDELWHTFITFTRDYAGFCDDVAGHFIHHVPTLPGAHPGADGIDGYARMLDAYEETFGEAPPREAWPARRASAPSGNSCTRAPHGDQCSPVTSGSACSPTAPSGSACAPAAPSGSAPFRAPGPDGD